MIDHLYLKKDKYFKKQHRIKDAKNDVLNNIQPSKFSDIKISLCVPDKEIRDRPLKSPFSDISRMVMNL